MKIILIATISIIVLSFLFIQWANKPENVAALQKKRAMEAAQKKEQAKAEVIAHQKTVVAQHETGAKKATMTLAIDEQFANNGFERLNFNYKNVSYFKVDNHELMFSGLIYKGQNAQDYFMYAPDDFGDFVAEAQMGIWGTDVFAGVFWDAQENGNQYPKHYQAAYSSPNALYVQTDDKERVNLGGLIASENNQLLRVERLGKHLTVSVNGRMLYNEPVESAGNGKVGLLIGHRGGIRNGAESMSIGIKRFRVWHG